MAEIVGFDISAKSIGIARKNNPNVELLSGTIDSLLDNERKYNLIFVAGVFHHIRPEDRAGVMQKSLS